MTEKDFIKEYFNKKNIINESAETALMFSFLSDFLLGSNPVAKMLLQYLGYQAARTAANVVSGKNIFGDKKEKNDRKDIKDFLDNKVKKEKDILKLVHPVPNSISMKRYPNRYLKYFLIIFTLQHFLSKNQKIKITEYNINRIYDNLQGNNYSAEFNEQTISLESKETYNIIENGVISINGKKSGQKGIDKDTFYEMIYEMFVFNPAMGEQLFIIINNQLKAKINSASLNYIFNLFYRNKLKYKIGTDSDDKRGSLL